MPTPNIHKRSRRKDGGDLAINESESPLAASVYSYVLPLTVVENDQQERPQQYGPNAANAAFVGNFSESVMLHDWQLAHWELPGLTNIQTNIVASDGTPNIITRRDVGGKPGHSFTERHIGPVSGPSSEWSGRLEYPGADYIGIRGPVGYLDYSSALAQTQAAANRMVYDQALIEAQLIASV